MDYWDTVWTILKYIFMTYKPLSRFCLRLWCRAPLGPLVRCLQVWWLLWLQTKRWMALGPPRSPLQALSCWPRPCCGYLLRYNEPSRIEWHKTIVIIVLSVMVPVSWDLGKAWWGAPGWGSLTQLRLDGGWDWSSGWGVTGVAGGWPASLSLKMVSRPLCVVFL